MCDVSAQGLSGGSSRSHPAYSEVSTIVPAAGNRNNSSGTSINNVGSNGNCWSSSANSDTNARNLNLNGTNFNWNNNNRANGLTVRPVLEVTTSATAVPLVAGVRPSFPSCQMKLTEQNIRDDLNVAYLDARRFKRTTIAQMEFEEYQEVSLEGLVSALVTRTYKPLPAFCFITFDPVQREVFASQFPDRVVQHMLYNYLAPFFERLFIHDTYSCRLGMGTDYGVKRYCHHLRSVTDNFTKEAWVLMVDLSGYFMSIDKALLFDTIMHELTSKADRLSDDHVHTWGEKLDIDFCEYLLHCFLDRNPAKDRIKLGKPSNWIGLPANKQLENSPEGIGIVIGDIISQLFSNINLNLTDQWAKREIQLEHWGHYVDDHFVMSMDLDLLNRLQDEILPEAFKNIAHVNLHPKKCHIVPADGANQFLGAYIRKGFLLPRQRTVDKFVMKMQMKEYDLMINTPTLQELLDIRASVNSYLGILSHYKSFNLRKKYIDTPAFNKYFLLDEEMHKITLKKQYLHDPYLIW